MSGLRLSRTPVIFVHTGQRRAVTLEAATGLAAARLGSERILVVTDQPLSPRTGIINAIQTPPPSELTREFERTSKLDRRFRGGFWHVTTKRLFILRDVMATLGIEAAWHVENDNILLLGNEDLERLGGNRDRVWLPFGGDDRVVASVVFAQIDALTRTLETLVELHRAFPGQSEMLLLAKAAAAGAPISPLPTMAGPNWMSSSYEPEFAPSVPKSYLWRTLAQWGWIFDALALGFYLIGQDPANQGYIQESRYATSNVTPDVSLLRWRVKGTGARAQLLVSHVAEEEQEFPVGNIHVHAKIFPKSPSDLGDYLEDWCSSANRLETRRSFQLRRMLNDRRHAPGEIIYFGPQLIRYGHKRIFCRNRGFLNANRRVP